MYGVLIKWKVWSPGFSPSYLGHIPLGDHTFQLFSLRLVSQPSPQLMFSPSRFWVCLLLLTCLLVFLLLPSFPFPGHLLPTAIQWQWNLKEVVHCMTCWFSFNEFVQCVCITTPPPPPPPQLMVVAGDNLLVRERHHTEMIQGPDSCISRCRCWLTSRAAAHLEVLHISS